MLVRVVARRMVRPRAKGTVPYVNSTPSMSQIQSRLTDPERGDNIQDVTGIFAFSTTCLRGFTVFKGDGHDPHEQPQSASKLPLPPQQGDSNFGDSSGPIFSMYSKLSKEEDDELVDRWQKDADGILIFVSPSVDVHTNAHTKSERSRLVFSLLRLLRYLPCQSQISGRILKTLPHSILAISIRFSPTRTTPYHRRPLFPLLLNQPRFLRRDTRSG